MGFKLLLLSIMVAIHVTCAGRCTCRERGGPTPPPSNPCDPFPCGPSSATCVAISADEFQCTCETGDTTVGEPCEDDV